MVSILIIRKQHFFALSALENEVSTILINTLHIFLNIIHCTRLEKIFFVGSGPKGPVQSSDQKKLIPTFLRMLQPIHFFFVIFVLFLLFLWIKILLFFPIQICSYLKKNNTFLLEEERKNKENERKKRHEKRWKWEDLKIFFLAFLKIL